MVLSGLFGLKANEAAHEIKCRLRGGMRGSMDNNYNQQTNANPYQQGNSYQQGDPYRQTGLYTGNSSGGSGAPYGYGSNPEPQKAPNIFQQFIYSFCPPRYDRLAKVKNGSMIGFVTLLTLIATIIMFASLILSLAADGAGGDWMDALPDFELSDGSFHINEDFLYAESQLFIYLTDDRNEFSYSDASAIAAEGYRNILLVGRDGISIMQNGEYQQVDFKDLGSDMVINKDWLVDTFMPIMLAVIVLAAIVFFVGRTFWYFLCAAVYFLFALIIAQIMKKTQPAGALFRAAVYSKVLMFVVAVLLDLIPFAYFSVPLIIRILITVAFMGVAIAKLPEKNS